MTAIGTRTEESGTLIREKGHFILRRDVGGRWRLDLHRIGADLIEGRVTITGTVVAKGLMDVDTIAPET